MTHEAIIECFLENYLTEHNVHFKSLKEIRDKLFLIMKCGAKEFQVISDFDRTMSKYRHNGNVNPTCHSIFEADPEITSEAKIELTELRKRYYPIEMDERIQIADKLPKMLHWWQRSHEIIVDCKLHKRALEKTVTCSGLALRDHVSEFTSLLFENEIPILVFSAGLGDVISILLRNFGLLMDNMRVISNFMKFDGNEVVTGFTSPVIHTFNKNASTVPGDICRRSCVLLLGDTISDARMADGAIDENCDGTVFRIGFLNVLADEQLDMYKKHYDIVITKDGSFEIPLALIKCLLAYWKTTEECSLKAEN